ncbi:Cdc7p-Dbf4p kinase complex regulatory subunit [Paramarasmius palmivorus]|uniref:Cdc7p-Dbf4p kinase complex regulatory subunit n=1 Tax=Paramarasmius palmivorus TaxID=297713 RepID=A0AAW0C918_9AGAR
MASIDQLPTRLPARMPLSPSVKQSRVISGTKRARSPAPAEQASRIAVKRARPTVPAAATPNQKQYPQDKKQRKAQEEYEFRSKYKRHIPRCKFYFDTANIKDETVVQRLSARIRQLGGQIEDFFQNTITHFICDDIDRALKSLEEPFEKENRSQHGVGSSRGGNALKRSPSKSTIPRPVEEESLIAKVKSWPDTKIWDIRKLDSVLSRCLQVAEVLGTSSHSQPHLLSTTNPNQGKKLTRLLQSEKLHGSTERDPTQKRPEYRYFSPGSYFLLIEDMRNEVATIAAMEWPATKRSTEKPAYPVLHCHPQSRGPFIPFDEREKRRWEKTQLHEKDRLKEQEEIRRKKMRQFEEVLKRKEAQKHSGRAMGDLRRSVSMNNLRRQDPDEECNPFEDVDHDDTLESANASGYLASGTGGYMAASGNSVQITSTTGTTSTSSFPLRRKTLPLSLQVIANQEILTSRKVSRPRANSKTGMMGPPASIPDKQSLLRKSKSMNTIRLSKREEGSKPGYCESCRGKFNDFKEHISSSKHRKFANNDANFSQLDCILDRVKRKTIEEVRRERRKPSTSPSQDQYDFFIRSDEDMYDVADGEM